MDQNFQADTERNILVLESQIRECFGRVVWSHKTQEKCADIVLRAHKRLKLLLILLSAITTTSLLFALFGDNKVGTIVGAICSSVLFALSSYSKDYDLGEIAQKHIAAANRLWDIRETYMSLLADIKIRSVDVQGIAEKRDKLQSELSNIYTGSPRTHSKAYKEASKALKKNQELTLDESEIDAFLPRELKKILPTVTAGNP